MGFLKDFFSGPPLESFPPEQRLEKLQLKRGCWFERDETLGIRFYGDKSIRKGEGDCFAIYIAKQDDKVWPRLVMGFSQSNIFTPLILFHTVHIRVDGDLYDVVMGQDTKRTTESLGVTTMCERADVNATDIVFLIRKIAESEETFVRFSGNQYHYEMKILRSHKEGLREMLELFDLETSILLS